VLREMEAHLLPFPGAWESHSEHLLASWSLKKVKSAGAGTVSGAVEPWSRGAVEPWSRGAVRAGRQEYGLIWMRLGKIGEIHKLLKTLRENNLIFGLNA
jgi:hypothetical protein